MWPNFVQRGTATLIFPLYSRLRLSTPSTPSTHHAVGQAPTIVFSRVTPKRRALLSSHSPRQNKLNQLSNQI